jgi:hypothetical protein
MWHLEIVPAYDAPRRALGIETLGRLSRATPRTSVRCRQLNWGDQWGLQEVVERIESPEDSKDFYQGFQAGVLSCLGAHQRGAADSGFLGQVSVGFVLLKAVSANSSADFLEDLACRTSCSYMVH